MSRGQRWIATLKKLPHTAPNANAAHETNHDGTSAAKRFTRLA